MAEDETGWLQNFSPSPSYDGAGSGGAGGSADDVLLAGHLDLVRALVTCHGASRLTVGRWCFGGSRDNGASRVIVGRWSYILRLVGRRGCHGRMVQQG